MSAKKIAIICVITFLFLITTGIYSIITFRKSVSDNDTSSDKGSYLYYLKTPELELPTETSSNSSITFFSD